MEVVLDFGSTVDMLNRHELADELERNEDRRLHALLTGVKQFRSWINNGTPGMGATTFTTSGNPPQGPASGYVWMVMNIGIELSAAAACRVYLNSGSNPAGGNRLVASAGSGSAFPVFGFAKGQFPVYAGDVIGFLVGSGSLQSIFMTGIEVPSERIGELLI